MSQGPIETAFVEIEFDTSKAERELPAAIDKASKRASEGFGRFVRRAEKGLDEVGDEAEDTGNRWTRSFRDAVTKSGAAMDRFGRNAEGSFGRAGNGLRNLVAAAGGLYVFDRLARGFSNAAEAAQESAKIQKLTEAVIKSTGGAANVSADQMERLATAQSNLSGVDDELIQGANNVLLTFTKVRNETGKGNDIFNQASKAALDMSAALGTDLQGAALQMGKALNDPIKGMTALSRAGVSFTQQQKDQVKAMVEAGDTLGAQKLILAEMQVQFGGAAEAAASPLDRLRVMAGNLQETLGAGLLAAIGPLGDAFAALAPTLAPVLEIIGKSVGEALVALTPLLESLPGLVARLGPLFTSMVEAAAPLVATLVPIFIALFDAIEPIIPPLIEVANQVLPVFVDIVTAVVRALAPFIPQLVEQLLPVLGPLADAFLQVTMALLPLLPPIIDALLPVLPPLISAVVKLADVLVILIPPLAQILAFFTTNVIAPALRAIAGAIEDVVSWLATFANWLNEGGLARGLEEIAEKWRGFIDGISRAWRRLVDASKIAISRIVETVKTLPGKAVAALANLGSALWGALTSAFSTASGAVGNFLSDVISAITSLPGRAASAVAGIAGALADVGRSIMQTIIDGISNAAGFIGDIGKTIYNSVAKFINDQIIDAFNRGLERIIDALPIPGNQDAPDLPKIPLLDTGGIVKGPTLAALAVNRVPEVVAPLPDLRRALGLDDAGPRQVIQNFDVKLVVPTADPMIAARQTANRMAILAGF